MNDLMFKAMNTIHRAVLTVSGGRLGNNLLKMPVVELTVTGRKSGEARTVMLTSPLDVDDGFVLVASRGGDDRHPAWFLNLQANPDVEVSVSGGPTQRATARVATGDERARLWNELTAAHSNYAGYQTKTDREIPVVVVTPK